MCSRQGHTVSKWLTMRELIRAEERLMFARHSQPRPPRKEATEASPRQAEAGSPCTRTRLLLSRKELY